MPLVKVQCTNCGGNLEVDSSKEAAICPFCNTPYVVEKAITQYVTKNTYNKNINIANATINVTGDRPCESADSYFDKWLALGHSDYAADAFRKYYPADPRFEYINMWWNSGRNLAWERSEDARQLAIKFLSNPKFEKYKATELAKIDQYAHQEKSSAANNRPLDYEKKPTSNIGRFIICESPIGAILGIVVIFLIIYFLVSLL